MTAYVDEGRSLVSGPSPRCFPHTDGEFERAIAAAIALHGDCVDRVIEELRGTYPQLRIVQRMAFATVDGDERHVWYCYRDGRPVPGGDGVGAMRLWTWTEAVTSQSLDLIEWSGDAIQRAHLTLLAAAVAVARRHTVDAR
jgi:hypothetical protein